MSTLDEPTLTACEAEPTRDEIHATVIASWKEHRAESLRLIKFATEDVEMVNGMLDDPARIEAAVDDVLKNHLEEWKHRLDQPDPLGPLFGTLKDGKWYEGVEIPGGLVMRGHPAT